MMNVARLTGYLKHLHAVIEADVEFESQRIRDPERSEADDLADEIVADIDRVDGDTASRAWRGLMFSRVKPKCG
jgi:hypothetical protein